MEIAIAILAVPWTLAAFYFYAFPTPLGTSPFMRLVVYAVALALTAGVFIV